MKVCLAGRDPRHRGGVVVALERLAPALRARGVAVDRWVIGREPGETSAYGAVLRTWRQRPPSDAHTLLHLNPSLRHRALLRDLALANLWPGPVVCWLHGWDPQVARAVGPNLGRLAPRVHWVALTQRQAGSLRGLGIEPIAVIGPPVPELDPGSPGGRHLCFVGRLCESKGALAAARAVARLAGEHPGLRLTMAGSGPQEAAIRELAQQGAPIHLAGSLANEDVFTLMATASALVLPSRAEGLSLAVLEAASAGLPVLCTDVGGLHDWLAPEGCVPIAAPDEQATAAAIATWLARGDANERGGGANRARAEAQAPRHVAAAFHVVYEALLA